MHRSHPALHPSTHHGVRRAARAASLLAAALLLGACDRADGGASSAALGALDTLATPAMTGSGEPNLAVAPDGRVYLSWLERQADSSHALRVASVAAGDTAWSAPRTVVQARDLFVNWADFPSVLALGDGRLVAHWLQRNGGGRAAYDVRIARSSDDGGSWSAPVTPHTDGTATEHGFVSMWHTGGDSVTALWLDGRNYAAVAGGHGGHGAAGAEMTLRLANVGPDGALAGEQLIDARVCDCCQTTATLTAAGPVVAFRDRSPEEIRDISVARLVNGRWTQPTPVHADSWQIAACPVNGPALASRGQQVALAWFTGAQDTARVRVAFSGDAGATWSAPARVDEGDPLGRVDAELLDDGSALVLWLERTGGEGAAVRLRRVRADGTLDAPITIAASKAARAAGFPRMVRGGEWLYLAWTEPGDAPQVRVARLRVAGAGA